MKKQHKDEKCIKVRKISALTRGDKFVATIADVQPTMLKLMIENGDVLTARAQVFPNARIGEQAVFMVKDNKRGKLLLELVQTSESNKRDTFDMRV